MKSPICDMLGIEFPLLAFSHCRDVVAAVSRAGGFGVLGATAHSPESVERELKWIDDHVDGKPYGIDVLIPENISTAGESNVTWKTLEARISQEHRDFTRDLLKQHGVELTTTNVADNQPQPFDAKIALEVLDASFRHPIRLIANALGPAPALLIERARECGVPCAGLVGAPEHAVRQLEAGVDIVIASGYEAGGHTGEIGTIVLVPEVIAAVEGRVPVLAAGGIVNGRQMAAAIALGATGVWTGSVWLTTHEAETSGFIREKILHATSRDVVRSRARTGKPARQLRTAWHDAWEGPSSPGTLPMPLMSMVSRVALARIEEAAEGGHEGARKLASYYAGQGVGLMTESKSAAGVVRAFMEEFAEAYEALRGAVEDDVAV